MPNKQFLNQIYGGGGFISLIKSFWYIIYPKKDMLLLKMMSI